MAEVRLQRLGRPRRRRRRGGGGGGRGGAERAAAARLVVFDGEADLLTTYYMLRAAWLLTWLLSMERLTSSSSLPKVGGISPVSRLCERRRSLSSERLPTVKGTCVRVRIRGRVRVRVSPP